MTDTIEPTEASGAAAASSAAPRRNSRVAPFAALGVAIAMIGLAVLLIGADPDGPNDANSPLLGKPAPEAKATDLRDGSSFDLSRRKGSYVVINFFRSDCVPCIQEHPELIEFVDQQRALPEDGAEFYSVAVGDTEEAAMAFFDERGGDWPVLFSENDQFSIAFGVAQVPETWIIGPNGFVRIRQQGRVNAESLSISLQQLREAG